MMQMQHEPYDPAARKAGVRRTVTILLIVIAVLLGLFVLQFVV